MFGSSIIPSIVWVFPLDVWPYAKIVPLYPESTSGNIKFNEHYILSKELGDLPFTMLLAVES